jgi:hypothetical protein
MLPTIPECCEEDLSHSDHDPNAASSSDPVLGVSIRRRIAGVKQRALFEDGRLRWTPKLTMELVVAHRWLRLSARLVKSLRLADCWRRLSARLVEDLRQRHSHHAVLRAWLLYQRITAQYVDI